MENREINCEICRCIINTEEAFKVKVGTDDYIEICESCYEGTIV